MPLLVFSGVKTIVISDLHERWQWVEPFLESEPHDEVVFLGDYFDDFTSTKDTAEATAIWLKHSLQQPKRKHCLGNHDLWYFVPESADIFYCPGNKHVHKLAIRKHLGEETLDSLLLFYETQGWILSHGGMSPHYFPPAPREMFLKQATKSCLAARANIKRNLTHPSIRSGRVRGGDESVGGIIWLDWYEFKPIACINQIVGHSSSIKVRRKDTEDSKNVCLDCYNRYVGFIEDGEFSYRKNPAGDWDQRLE
jgi:UDP-2,3-diacylglucosamine pyrophosphatase LpxH